MFNNNRVANAIRLALVLGVSSTAISAPAFAAETGVEAIEKIEVTGSRISRTDMETASPVTIIDASAILASGALSIGDLLQNIPAASGAMSNPAVYNGSGGNSTINLRGLGSNRTLVLLNGRRMISSGTGAASSVDLNTIPVSMIARIEILKDGASAIYGTDAVAGVVNVILKRNFDGFEMNMQTGISGEGDAEESTIDFTLGASSAKGNVVFGLSYTDRGEAMQADRKWSECPLFESGDGSAPYCGGSSSSIGGHVFGDYEHELTYTGVSAEGDAIPAIGDAGYYGHYIADKDGDPSFDYYDDTKTEVDLSGRDETDGSYHDFNYGTVDNDYYNYAEASYLSTPMKRINFTASGTYELTDDLVFFSEATYTKRWSKSQMAPEPVSFVFDYDPTWMTNVSGIQTGETITYRRRLEESGPRIFNQNVDTIRFVIGVEGVLNNGWDWDVSYNKGKNDSTEKTQNYHYKTGIDNAIAAKTFDPLSQAPWQDLSEYKFTEVEAGGSEMDIFAITLTGGLFELPAGEVAFATGYEHRTESAYFTPGSVGQLGLGADDPVEATNGSFKVDEVYVEFAIPLLADLAFAKSLELSAAIRYFDYNTFGDDTTWKLGLTWKINDQIMLRGVASTAFRAPTVDELFGGTGVSFDTINHPASDQTQGLVTVGSNPDLTPEEADTFTLGVVYEPEIIEGLSLTLDYYDIALTNAIEKTDSSYVAKTCLSATGIKINNDLEMCKAADIALVAGQIEFTNLTGNVGLLDTSGVDFNITYAFDLAGLEFRTSLDTSFLNEYEKADLAGNIVDYKGMITAAKGSYADIKSNFSLSVTADDWSARYAARYIGSVDDASCDPVECYAPSVDAITYHDISGAYYFSDNITLSGGINNLLDEDAPYYTGYYDSNTDPYTYDVLGRYFFVKASFKF